jgi:hypothetical protein
MMRLVGGTGSRLASSAKNRPSADRHMSAPTRCKRPGYAARSSATVLPRETPVEAASFGKTVFEGDASRGEPAVVSEYPPLMKRNPENRPLRNSATRSAHSTSLYREPHPVLMPRAEGVPNRRLNSVTALSFVVPTRTAPTPCGWRTCALTFDAPPGTAVAPATTAAQEIRTAAHARPSISRE